ncbi:WD repeat-containing protein ATCSA-1-like isoform X1 [Telopea speciosissima]|uniref:WD repeat-containing protein ATCSA-1-like isoform X1 n=1 Tax=Telopea speciosissima TaxID=54955 RepID=UPI001CC7A10E|nr:WD repeat-containing protein ATCSA-1-like isoform X1 [Telopea speciosissima]
MWKEVRDREAGKLRPYSFANRIRSNRVASLQLSNYKEIISSHSGAINTLQVDLTEGRYLLSGAADGSAAVYDVQCSTDYEGGGLIAKHKCILFVDKQHEHGHQYAVSSAIWYPVDTGLFITGSFDHHINVWDTNSMQVVANFKMPGKVYRTAMSSIATSHMLIAAGTEDVQVRLCDIASGAFTHTLSGHRDGVMTAEWSASSEWILVTGGCDGAIRFWDIRRAGCFLVLDQTQTQLGRRPPLHDQPSMKSSILKSSLPGQSSFGKNKTLHRKTGNGALSKQLPALCKVPGQIKGSSRQRVHPGMLSSHDRATAHYGAVTGLKVTEDGMYLLSAGSDSRLRLWDIESGRNTLVNFETVRLQTSKAIQLAVTQDSDTVFVPCMTSVKAFDVWSGQTSLTFRGHYEYVNCCSFNSQEQELYTGSNDRQILVWSPRNLLVSEVDESSRKGQILTSDQDNWSD